MTIETGSSAVAHVSDGQISLSVTFLALRRNKAEGSPGRSSTELGSSGRVGTGRSCFGVVYFLKHVVHHACYDRQFHVSRHFLRDVAGGRAVARASESRPSKIWGPQSNNRMQH